MVEGCILRGPHQCEQQCPKAIHHTGISVLYRAHGHLGFTLISQTMDPPAALHHIGALGHGLSCTVTSQPLKQGQEVEAWSSRLLLQSGQQEGVVAGLQSNPHQVENPLFMCKKKLNCVKTCNQEITGLQCLPFL